MSADLAASPTPYQLLPRLTEDEYQALKADIAENGIRVPIDVDEDGTVLDGHHRSWIAADLNVDCPRRVVAGLTDEQKRAHALAANVYRRSLTREQRRELVARLRQDGMAVRAIAKTIGSSVGSVARDLPTVPTGTVPDRIVGADGKSRPASRPVASPASETPPARKPRRFVVAAVSAALLRAREAAGLAEQVTAEHLRQRNSEAAVWGRGLASSIESLVALRNRLEEATR